MIIKQKKSKKPITIVAAVLASVIVLALGYLAYARSGNHWPFSITKTAVSTDTKTTMPQGASDNSKDTTYDTNKGATNADGSSKDTGSNPGTATSPRTTVEVGVTSADTIDNTVEIRAYVHGVIEGSGTCTATLTATSGTIVTGTSQGFVNATSTQCETIMIPKSKVPSGSWKVVVDYSSPTSTGTSPALEASL